MLFRSPSPATTAVAVRRTEYETGLILSTRQKARAYFIYRVICSILCLQFRGNSIILQSKYLLAIRDSLTLKSGRFTVVYRRRTYDPADSHIHRGCMKTSDTNEGIAPKTVKRILTPPSLCSPSFCLTLLLSGGLKLIKSEIVKFSRLYLLFLLPTHFRRLMSPSSNRISPRRLEMGGIRSETASFVNVATRRRTSRARAEQSQLN